VCGEITGTVTDASTGMALAGAVVAVQGTAITATSATDGTFTIACAPAGSQTLSTSRTGYGTRTDSVTVPGAGTVDVAIALNPLGSCGAVGEVKIVLTWGLSPSDLDSHLSGPDIENAGQTRFHMVYFDRDPVSYVSLDVDDVSSFGPETVTVTRVAAGFVAGEYHYWIHNFSNSPEFNGSSAVITVSQCDANLTPVQVTQFSVANASGDPTLDLWHVFDFSLTSGGTLSITPVQTFLAGFSTTVL
jgi:uncharacterized protein YfaP (DUF2135 family)